MSDPHLHIARAQLNDDASIDRRIHFPTGRVAFEQVALFLVVELGVQPARPDYQKVLDTCLGRFARWRTWATATHLGPS